MEAHVRTLAEAISASPANAKRIFESGLRDRWKLAAVGHQPRAVEVSPSFAGKIKKGPVLTIDTGSLVLVNAADGALSKTNARRVLVVIVGATFRIVHV